MTSAAIHGASAPEWLRVLRRYMLFSAVLHLIWEIGHIPLYTIWLEGTWGDIAFAIVHCTGGDILIAMSTMLLRSEEHTSELQSLMRISYAVFCLKKTKH